MNHTFAALTFADGVNVDGSIDNSLDTAAIPNENNRIVVTFNGSSTISGEVGATHPIMNLNVGNKAIPTVTFESDATFGLANITEGGIDFQGDVNTGVSGME
ncbi:MAG UNVERIFIED_CONTAM: hypothetical protein LVQ98_01545 [Rickettsiaceae bacterium]|jgi:hypothetical protein